MDTRVAFTPPDQLQARSPMCHSAQEDTRGTALHTRNMTGGGATQRQREKTESPYDFFLEVGFVLIDVFFPSVSSDPQRDFINP